VAQEAISKKDFAEYTYSFLSEDGQFSGEGFDFLKNEIEGSQFFLLGEYHNDAGISILTNALLPILAEEGYRHFAVETGPVSAQKLTELGKNGAVQQNLRDFYTEQMNLTGDIPIPFFGGIEDAQFLETALKLNYDLWGLDQEYLGGYLFLLEELWQQSEFPERKRSSYEAARKRIISFYEINRANEDIEVYDNIRNDEIVQSFLDKSTETKECRCCLDIASEIKESCEIYHNWKADLTANLEGRTDLMKRHFIKYYESTNERMPKVFVKMGGMHTARGFTGNADFELGNMLHEWATINGKKDVNVSFATRYYLDDETGEIGDNLTYDSEWVENMTPLLSNADTLEWKIVDLRPIKKLWINRERTLNPQLKRLIKQHDFIIIMPPLPETVPNYAFAEKERSQ